MDRDALFLTTKIWTENLPEDKPIPSLKDSLKKLRSDHVDLTLIHWPSPGGVVPVAESMGALNEARAQGLTTRIGVSNFNTALMKQAIAAVGAEAMATNQIEPSPFLQNREVVHFAESQGIPIASYMTLACGQVLKDPVMLEIAQMRGATAAQVALAWAMQLGYAVISSSTKRENLASNLRAQELTLNEGEMARIALLDRGGRQVKPEGLAPLWD